MRHGRPVCSLLFLLIAITLGGFGGPLSAFELTVSPPRLELLLEPGKTVEGAITVTGRFAQPTRIRVTADDWTLGTDGEMLLECGPHARSLARWLSVAPAEFLLGEGRRQIVRYRLQPPPDITGGYWGIIFFQGVLPKADPAKGTVGVTIASRLATTVYAATERGAVRDGKVTGVAATWSNGRLSMGATFANHGNLMVRLKGRFEIRETTGNRILAKVSFEDLPVLPGGSRNILAEWRGDLAPGNYVLLALVDYGGRNNVAGQRVFKVVN